MKFGIALYSKYTGNRIILGSQFDSKDEATKYADKNCCHKCNSVSIIPIHDGNIWVDAKTGFMSEKLKEQFEKKNTRG